MHTLDSVIIREDAIKKLSVLGIDGKKLSKLTSRGVIKSVGKDRRGYRMYQEKELDKFINEYQLPPGKYLTRKELLKVFKSENIYYSSNNLSHLISNKQLPATFNKLTNEYVFKETDVKKFLISYGDRYRKQQPLELEPLTLKDAERKYGKLIYKNLNEITERYINVGPVTLKNLISQGYFRDMYLLIGIDLKRPKDCPKRTQYAFIKEKLMEFNSRYVTLDEAAKRLNVPHGTLTTWSYKGLLESVGNTRFVWDLELIRDTVEKSKEQQLKGFGKRDDRHQPLLGCHMDMIKRYIKYREYNPIIFDFKHIEKPGFFSDERKSREESTLSIVFFRIIAGRASIGTYYKKLTPYALLFSEDEKELFKQTAERFVLTQLTPDDLISLREGSAEGTYQQYCFTLKKLLYWFLSNFEKRSDFITFRKTDEWENLRHSILNVIAHMPQKLTIKEPDPKKKHFLDIQRVLKVYRAIEQGQGIIDNPFKSSLQWMIGFFCAIRPYEIMDLRIFDFWLNEETGFLRKFKFDKSIGKFIETSVDDPDGFGTLFVVRSKQGKSPSKIFEIDGLQIGTIIVPRLVDYINMFLKDLYNKNPELKGEDGWLFRPFDSEPDHKYLSTTHLANWVKKIRTTFDFIEPKKVRNFQFKNSRHSVHNHIVNERLNIVSATRLIEIAGLHLRHSGNSRREKTMGQKHYTEPALFKDYFEVINATLNFPWDQKELEKWLIDNTRLNEKSTISYNEQISNGVDPFKEPEFSEEHSKIINELEFLIREADIETKRGPGKGKNKMAPSEYLQHVEHWTKKKNQLQAKLKKVKTE